MGQAKQRGTFEQRKAAAEQANLKERIAKAQSIQMRSSPKLSIFFALALAATAHAPLSDNFRE